MTFGRSITGIASILICALTLVACGGDDPDTDPAPPPNTATTGSPPPTTAASPSTTTPDTGTVDTPDTAGSINDDGATGDDAISLEPNAEGVYSADQILYLVHRKFDEFAWPEGYIPADPEGYLQVLDDEMVVPDLGLVPVRYQKGFEYTVLEGRNQCAWLLTWRDALLAGDDATVDEALDRLRTLVEESPVMVPYDQERWLGWIEQAQLGDPSMLQGFTGGCTDIIWETPTPAPAS